MDILIIIAMLLQSYVGAPPDSYQAEQIVKAMSNISPQYKQDILIMVAIESSFDEKETSPAGARGLLQLMPIAVEDVVQKELCGITKIPKDIYNVTDNIKVGSCFYEYLMLKYKNRDKALAYYNGGTPAVKALRKGKPFPETAYYISRFKELESKLPTNNLQE